MRAFPLWAALVTSALLGCNQDSAASNGERETHMGDIRAVPVASSESPLRPPSSTTAMAPAVGAPSPGPVPTAAAAPGLPPSGRPGEPASPKAH